jgi:DNA-binding GntR family transcriptional regulator
MPPSSTTGRHRQPLAALTRTEQVYAQLRADILAGRISPGTKLRFADLTERYDCSTSVVREGLTRLAEPVRAATRLPRHPAVAR